MAIDLTSPQTHADDLAAIKALLPTSMGSAEIREQYAQEILSSSVFSARTTNAVYLQAIKERLQRALKGGYNADFAQLRLELKQTLQVLGYTPEKGFAGDEALDIPPAKPGSLKDLGSDARINLILDTNVGLMRGAGQKAAGMQAGALEAFPAWELIRIFQRRKPRGTVASGAPGWESRWVQCGGTLLNDRMVALKDDPIWGRLGSKAYFDDALGVDHPPFAYNSGMGWDDIGLREWRQLNGGSAPLPDQRAQDSVGLPKPQFSSRGLDADMKAKLIASLKGTGGKIDEQTLGALVRKAASVNSRSMRFACALWLALN